MYYYVMNYSTNYINIGAKKQANANAAVDRLQVVKLPLLVLWEAAEALPVEVPFPPVEVEL